MPASRSAPALTPDARYQFERRLGEGGSGAVFLVRDTETGEQLALKKLLRVDPKSVLRLKREFRSMQAVKHPNIIKLYDMGQAEDSWFMTMEYLDGLDLGSYLRAEPYDAADPVGSRRLLPAFRQLARGIHALHEAGLLHRDLKPSNVIAVGQRVVVLDFGLVRRLDLDATRVTEEGSVSGTPAYMAPEQLLAKELSAASDWYAFGVMLYEAVSGMLPIDGTQFELLRAKLESDPEPLSTLVPEAPSWLCELCSSLLQRDPAQRPSGEQVLARLDAVEPQLQRTQTGTEHVPQTETEVHEAHSQLFGRDRELEQLWSAYERAQAGRAVMVHVRAASGAGKSALVEHFAHELELRASARVRADTLVLRSRCYEQEAMPFKALDGLLDALVQHLSRVDDVEVAHLLPIDVAALSRVFPVFERLTAVKRLAASGKLPLDALQIRRRAEEALRSLLYKLALQTPLVLWIDDLQWGDLDSAAILRSWLLQPWAAAIMCVFSYRSDEVATSSCLHKLLGGEPLPIDTIDLAPLPGADIAAMCERRLRSHDTLRPQLIEQIVRESQGSPFLASQLIALADAKATRGETDLEGLSLDLMVAQTSAILSADAKSLLAVLAIAGRPMSPKLALKAAGIAHGGRALVHELRGLNLVRTRDVGGARMLEVYHDHIRERVLRAQSDEESRALFGALFKLVELSGHADADWLHSLALGAGLRDPTLRYGKAAAARANASLAFDRAAALFRACIELDPAAGGELWSELSMSLARGGQGVAAAETALEAAKHVSPEQASSWTQLAATHYMRCGHYAEGAELNRRVLEAAQIDVPSSDAGLIAAIVWERTRLKLRGPKPVERAANDYPNELLKRVDVLMGLWASTQSSDTLRSTLFQLRALRAALEAGEPTRLVRVLCASATATAVAGTAEAASESDALVERAVAISAAMNARDEVLIASTRAINAFMLGRFKDVVSHADAAERLFRADAQDDPGGNYNRRFVTALVRIGTLHALGQYERFKRELPAVIEDARATDNRAVLLQLTYTHTSLEQLLGHGARSRARLDAEIGELPTTRVNSLYLLHMVAVMSAACWSRDFAWGRLHLEEAWTRYLRSPLRLAASMAMMAHDLHGRFSLNEAIELDLRADPAALVAPDLRALRKLAVPMAKTAELRLRGRVALLTGKRIDAAALLRESSNMLDELGSPHEAARDQFALGAAVGGSEGETLRSGARARIRALGIMDVDADLRAYFPEALRGSDGPA
ncbi:MAG TPA: protein kinase [Polyangiales bacterium]|nr:protein kinase [Polyangiales bacterium]